MKVFTGDLGAAQHFWYPFSPYYWGIFAVGGACNLKPSLSLTVGWLTPQVPDTLEPGDTVGRIQQLSALEGSVRAHKVSKSYGKTTALTEVSLVMPPGQLVALLGQVRDILVDNCVCHIKMTYTMQNGAGKTTLVHILCGLISPTHGEAYFLSATPSIIAVDPF